MTPPSTPPPEAIAALAAEIARLTDAADNHNAAWVAACDRIAALEAERDALNEELREARMQAIADGVQFQMDMEDLTAERDEALIRAERSERAERAAHDAANTAIKQRDEVRAQVRRLNSAVTGNPSGTICDACRGTGLYHCVDAFYGCGGMRDYTLEEFTAALARRDAAMRNEGRRQAAGLCKEMGDQVLDAEMTGVPEQRRLRENMGAAFIKSHARILAALEPEGGE